MATAKEFGNAGKDDEICPSCCLLVVEITEEDCGREACYGKATLHNEIPHNTWNQPWCLNMSLWFWIIFIFKKYFIFRNLFPRFPAVSRGSKFQGQTAAHIRKKKTLFSRGRVFPPFPADRNSGWNKTFKKIKRIQANSNNSGTNWPTHMFWFDFCRCW